jgi:hypothetical protein
VTEQEGQEEGGVEEKDCTTQQWSQGEWGSTLKLKLHNLAVKTNRQAYILVTSYSTY